MIQKRRHFLWAKAHFKMDCGKVENCSVVRRIKIWSSFWKTGTAMSSGLKEDKDYPSCLSALSSEACISDGMGLHECVWHGQLTHLEGTINAERYIQVLEQHMLPSRRRLFQGRPCIFQHDNARPHTASITTSWLRRRRIRVLKWPACRSRSFTQRKHLAHHKEEDATKKT